MPANGPWSRIECERIVADYFAMLERDLRDEPYSKAAHRRALQTRLDGRGDGAVEYKHQNISAVLLRAGRAYIPGYKPAWNYQQLLEDVVLDRLASSSTELVRLEDLLLLDVPDTEPPQDWQSVFVQPPAREPASGIRQTLERHPVHIDFAAREARARALGERGEQWVLQLERQRLTALGRKDLAAEVQWTSREQGDGTGYDIRSFRDATDEELFIEVKTTNSGLYQPFLLTRNEADFSRRAQDQYALYRVFGFRRDCRLYALQGDLSRHVHLDPAVFRASFRL